MADYKSIIKGTVSALTEKAKNLAESGAVRDAYDRGSTTARCYAVIAKLNLQINGELEEQKKLFCDIGRMYYEQHRGTPEQYYAEFFDKLRESDRKIEEMREELEAAKAAVELSRRSDS